MLSRGEDVEAHALKERGWSVLAIARHLGRSDEPAPAAMMYLAGRVPQAAIIIVVPAPAILHASTGRNMPRAASETERPKARLPMERFIVEMSRSLSDISSICGI